MRRRRLALGGLVVALAITAAACGGGGTGQAAVSIKTLQAAVGNTQAEPSSRFVMDLAVDADGHSMTIHGEGVSAGDGRNGQITMTIPSAGTLEERIVDGTVYMNFGDLLGTKLGGKQWVFGHRDAAGWQTDIAVSDASITRGVDYSLSLILTGSQAILVVNGVSKVNFTFGSALTGSVGLGSTDSVTQFTNLDVQQYTPPSVPPGTLPIQEDFSSGQAS